MDESLVRYSKLSMITATNRFSIYACMHTNTHSDTHTNRKVTKKVTNSH